MTDSELKELRSHLEEYLNSKGISTDKLFRCLNPSHEDKHPSMSYDKNRHRVKCFSKGVCGVSYDLLDVIGLLEPGHDTPGKQIKRALELYPMHLSGTATKTKKPTTKASAAGLDFSSLPAKEKPEATLKPSTPPEPQAAADVRKKPYRPIDSAWHDDLRLTGKTQGYKYWTNERGLTDSVINKFKLGYDAAWKVVTIPVNETYYITRKLDTHQFYNNLPDGERVSPFNLEALHQAEPVFVTEAAIDAMSIEALGFPAVSINGTPHAERFIDYLKDHPDRIKTRMIILALDSDDEGQETQKDLLARLTDMGHETIELIMPPNWHAEALKNGKKCVDPNLALKLHRDAFLSVLKQISENKPEIEVRMTKKESKQTPGQERINQMAHEVNSIKNFTNDFFETAPDGHGIKTGLEDLNDILDGGLFEGLYMIGGISGVSKTSLALQMASFMAEHGSHVVYVHYEQGRRDLMNKIISARTYMDSKATAATLQEVRLYRGQSETTRTACDKALKHIHTYKGDLAIYQSDMTNIPAMMTQYRDLNPVLIVDYLHIMANPPDFRSSGIYEEISARCKMLRQLATEYSMPVILISSTNRKAEEQENLERFEMGFFRDSGYIGYSADLALGLCPVLGGGSLQDWHENDTRRVKAIVVKNRNGSHKTAELIFHAPYSYFENTKHHN